MLPALFLCVFEMSREMTFWDDPSSLAIVYYCGMKMISVGEKREVLKLELEFIVILYWISRKPQEVALNIFNIMMKLNTNHIFDITKRSSCESTFKWLMRWWRISHFLSRLRRLLQYTQARYLKYHKVISDSSHRCWKRNFIEFLRFFFHAESFCSAPTKRFLRLLLYWS